MLKVLMADDEFLVRLAFTNTVNWSEHGFIFVGAAADGEEAYQIFLREHPDIIITDLSMPMMNGLELIDKIQKMGSKCEFIVLSCHNEFEYVKEALKLGVFDYILKLSMDMKELMDILAGLRKKILQDRPEQLFLNESSEDADLINSEFRIIVMETSCAKAEETDKKHEQIIGFIQHVLGEIRNKLIFLYRNIPTILIWERTLELEYLLSKIQEDILKYTGMQTQIGVGSVVHGNQNIRRSYEEAMLSYHHRFYIGEESICYFDQISYTDEEMGFGDLFPEISEALDLPLTKEMKDIIDSSITRIRHAENVEPDHLRTFLHELCTRLKIKVTEQCGQNSCGGIYTEICRKIHKLEFLSEIQDEVLYFLDAMMEMVECGQENEIIRLAKKYLHKNWNGDVRLMELSRQLGVNADYLSHLFRTETGMKYIDYVNHIRVERACGFLRNTKGRIYEVADLSGFENTNYFIRVFKGIMGVTPQDYRRNVSFSKNCDIQNQIISK